MSLLELPQATHDLLGIDLTADQQHAFDRYTRELLDWNERVNLTAITEPLAVEIRHFLDSLSILRVAHLSAAHSRVIDVGAGAGFPGLPLRIVAPQIQLTLLEATGKKTTFLEHVANVLNLNGVKVVNMRAEDAGQHPSHREQYDLVVARAVAHLPILLEYLLPLCRIGGRCIAMKGESAATEISAAENSMRLLGGRLAQLTPIELPHVAETHYLIVIDKVAATPNAYPRKPGIPSKKPL